MCVFTSDIMEPEVITLFQTEMNADKNVEAGDSPSQLSPESSAEDVADGRLSENIRRRFLVLKFAVAVFAISTYMAYPVVSTYINWWNVGTNVAEQIPLNSVLAIGTGLGAGVDFLFSMFFT